MKSLRLAQFLLLAFSVLTARAQIAFDGKYEQNFDALPTAVSAKLPGTDTVGAQAEIPSLPGWEVARLGGEAAGMPLKLVDNAGDKSEGRLYSFGQANTANRSLGAISTNGSSLAFGAAFVNKTGKTINRVSVAYTGEIWRGASRAQDRIPFFYGVSADGIGKSDFLTNPTMKPCPDLDLDAPSVGKSNTPFDGKAADNRAAVTATLDNLDWEPGSLLFLAWRAENKRGLGAGLAMDDFVIRAQ